MKNAIIIIVSIVLSHLSLFSQTVVTVNSMQETLSFSGDSSAVKKLIVTGDISGKDFSKDSEWGMFRTLNTIFPNLDTVELYTAQDIPDGNYTTGGMFSNVKWLKSFSAAHIKKIGNNTFSYCRNLETIDFPSVTTIGKAAFMFCPALETVSFPGAIEAGAFSFHNCSSLSSMNFPALETIGEEAFSFCQQIQTASFPKVKTVGDFAFNPCLNLSEIIFPVVTEISDFAFSNDERLISAGFGADFDSPTTIKFRNNVFSADNQLTNRIDLILSENVLPPPNKDNSIWQSNNNNWDMLIDYIWKSITVNPATGIKSLAVDNQLKIYPNPVPECFQIKGNTENGLMRIVDVTGKIVMQKSVTPDEIVFVQHLNRGIYFVMLNGKTVKIIKQ